MSAAIWARVGYTVWERWKAVAHSLGVFQARLLLSLFYLVVVTPFGLGVKMLSDPLRLKHRLPFGWLRPNHKTPDSLDAMRKQY